MNHTLKIFLFAGGLVLSHGGLSCVSAQTTTSAASNLALPPASDIQTAAPNRVYVGTVTRTSVAGETSKGDILMSVTPAGEVTANLTINGKVHPYFGQVAVVDHGPATDGRKTKQRSGTLRALHVISNPSSGGSVVIATTELPLTITATNAYGGVTDRNGSPMVFTASRIGLALATGGQPILVSPVSGGTIGTITGTTPGG